MKIRKVRDSNRALKYSCQPFKHYFVYLLVHTTMPSHLLPNLALKNFFPVVIFGMLLHFSK